jgi:hypothetical protein
MPSSPGLAGLAGLVDRLGDRYGCHPGWLPGLTLSRASRVTEPLSDISRPVLALIAQGAKRTVLANQIYDYRAGQYLIATVDLPLTAQVTEAPFLALGLPLKRTVIAGLLLETGPGTELTASEAGNGGPTEPAQRAPGRRLGRVAGTTAGTAAGIGGPGGSSPRTAPPAPASVTRPATWWTRWCACSDWLSTERTSRCWPRRPSARSTGG